MVKSDYRYSANHYQCRIILHLKMYNKYGGYALLLEHSKVSHPLPINITHCHLKKQNHINKPFPGYFTNILHANFSAGWLLRELEPLATQSLKPVSIPTNCLLTRIHHNSAQKGVWKWMWDWGEIRSTEKNRHGL